MRVEARCQWDGHRAINDLVLGGGIDRSSHRWILESVDDGGASENFVDALLDLTAHMVDNVMVSITCRDTFFVPGRLDNMIGRELWGLLHG